MAGSTAAWLMSTYGAGVPAGLQCAITRKTQRSLVRLDLDSAALLAGSLCATLQSVSMAGATVGLGPIAAVVGGAYLAGKGVQSYRNRQTRLRSKL